MHLIFKDNITAVIIELSCKSIFFEPIEDRLNGFKGLKTKCRRRARRKNYVFLDPAKMEWNEENGPRRWTNKGTVLPPMHYIMHVVIDREGPHDWKSLSYTSIQLTVEWFDIEPGGDISLDDILQRAVSIIEYNKYA